MCDGNLETWAWVCSAGYQMSTLWKSHLSGELTTLFLIGISKEQVPTPPAPAITAAEIHAVPHPEPVVTISHAGLDFESITRTHPPEPGE